MPAPSPESIARSLALAASGGRAAAEASLLAWAAKHPSLPCAHCFGRGAYAEAKDGARRVVDETLSPERGDRFVGCCPACRGFGRISATQAEVVADLERRLDAARASYRLLRAAVMAERGMTEAAFDKLARRRLDPARTPSPRDWLEAAASLARDFGIGP